MDFLNPPDHAWMQKQIEINYAELCELEIMFLHISSKMTDKTTNPIAREHHNNSEASTMCLMISLYTSRDCGIGVENLSHI